MPDKPSIVLIHGFWVTPRSWENWVKHYEAKGYEVHAPAYPGLEVEVEALNQDPTPLRELTIDGILSHLIGVVEAVDGEPILIGHSAGGVFTQLLMDRGYGRAGVAISSAPTEGVAVVPLSQIKAAFPVLKDPLHKDRAVALDRKQWHYAFANTLSEEESNALHERYAIPASGSIFWESAMATLRPGHQGTYVNYKNDERAPLLFISGSEDNLMPPSVQASNAKHYKSDTVTEVEVVEGRDHAIIAEAGWEEVADRALKWALAQSA